jgi:hypothetical protein
MLPPLPPFVKRLNERLAVYYCTDDYGSLTDVNERAVQAMDEEIRT